MEEEKVIRLIAMILAKKSKSWESLSNQKKVLAVKVYIAATEKLNRLEELDNEMKKYYFTKSSLAVQLGINRKTLGHNNPEVSIIIDELVNEERRFKLNNDSCLIGEIANLKSEIEQFKERDSRYVEKDIDCQDWINKYQEQLKISNNQKIVIAKLKKEIDKLNKEIDKLTTEQLITQLGPANTSHS